MIDDQDVEGEEGLGELRRAWHVSPSPNRESIRMHGLDPSRMGAAGGIASGSGARGPEALEPGPDGWVVHRSPIPPDRIELAARDVRTSGPSTTGAGARPSRTSAPREAPER